MNKEDRGTILVSAVRYALGRQTYIVSDTCRIVRESAYETTDRQREIIEHDIRTALAQCRAGAPCDEREWVSLLEWLGASSKVTG
jgi:hypothetical protein